MIRKPSAAELPMGLDAPHGQPARVQLHPLEGEQQTGQLSVLEEGHIFGFEGAAVQQYAGLGEQLIDAVHPLLGVAAAALEDDALLAAHAAQVVGRDLFYHELVQFSIRCGP